MRAEPFPTDLLLDEPKRGQRLLAEFYQKYHANNTSTHSGGPNVPLKIDFFRETLVGLGLHTEHLGVDIGCRFGHMIKKLATIDWLGVDVDPTALEVAVESGIRCHEMDFMFDIPFRDDCLKAVLMTEVLEHLPFPFMIVRDVNRILKKEKSSVFMGSVPLDYHLHRRWKVLRGKRLSGDQTHTHHFSFDELDHLLRFYFHEVKYLPLAGTAFRHPKLGLPYNLFVRDIAWAASSPKQDVAPWDVRSS